MCGEKKELYHHPLDYVFFMGVRWVELSKDTSGGIYAAYGYGIINAIKITTISLCICVWLGFGGVEFGVLCEKCDEWEYNKFFNVATWIIVCHFFFLVYNVFYSFHSQTETQNPNRMMV